MVVFSSGSTGRPRGVVRTVDSWQASVAGLSAITGITGEDRVWLPGPLWSSLYLYGAHHASAVGAEVVLRDEDPAATTAARVNADLNGVVVEVRTADVLDEPARADVTGGVVLAGDLFYERGLAIRSTAWLRRQAAAGAWALAGDAERSYAPTDGIRVLAEFLVDTHAGIERGPTASVRVLEILPTP